MRAQEFIAAREAVGLTQLAFSQKLGLPLQTIQAIEDGEAEAPGFYALAIDMIRLQSASDRMNVIGLSPQLQSLVSKLGRQLYPS
ncbi:helix-turn-helix domain-containing protein [Neorhizobium sp. DT-125]|uniref:helix-turn-helix domain-containing protein n=1 Tax=Neorhizobium sp. DT-125 TaxID=3396163 RepID=UPI003F1C1DC0